MNPELEAKLSALLDGELSPAEAAALRAEIARSPKLAERLAALAAVDDGLRTLPHRTVSSDLRARIERQIRAEAPPRVHAGAATGSRRRWLTAAALAAAAAVLALLALPRIHSDETQVASTEPAPAPQTPAAPLPPVAPVAPPAPELAPAPAPQVQIAEQAPPPAFEDAEPVAAEELAEAEDLPVIEVLDVLAELDELEQVGSG